MGTVRKYGFTPSSDTTLPCSPTVFVPSIERHDTFHDVRIDRWLAKPFGGKDLNWVIKEPPHGRI